MTRQDRFAIDSRGQMLLRAATRTLFDIATGDRVVLVAAPKSGVLIAHPVAVVSEPLIDFQASTVRDADERRAEP